MFCPCREEWFQAASGLSAQAAKAVSIYRIEDGVPVFRGASDLARKFQTAASQTSFLADELKLDLSDDRIYGSAGRPPHPHLKSPTEPPRIERRARLAKKIEKGWSKIAERWAGIPIRDFKGRETTLNLIMALTESSRALAQTLQEASKNSRR